MKPRSTAVPPTVITVIEPEIRTRLDLFGEGTFTAVHKNCVREVVQTSSLVRPRTVLISTKFIGPGELPLISSLLRRSVDVLAVRSDTHASAELQLGACGVRTLLDLRDGMEWRRLRALVCDGLAETRGRIQSGIASALQDATDDTKRFFDVLICEAPRITRVQDLALALGILPGTLLSRFFRIGLPSPKRYLAEVRLLYAAALLENGGRSISAVANELEYSSPQSFGRHLQGVLRLSPSQFRWRYDLEHALQRYLSRMLLPFGNKLSAFHPLQNGGKQSERVRCC